MLSTIKQHVRRIFCVGTLKPHETLATRQPRRATPDLHRDTNCEIHHEVDIYKREVAKPRSRGDDHVDREPRVKLYMFFGMDARDAMQCAVEMKSSLSEKSQNPSPTYNNLLGLAATWMNVTSPTYSSTSILVTSICAPRGLCSIWKHPRSVKSTHVPLRVSPFTL